MEIRHLRRLINLFRTEVNPEIPSQQIELFLLVCERDGITQTEIAKEMSMPQATVSRNVAKLGNKVVTNRKGNLKKIGYGLVENRQDVVYDPRRLAVFLTPAGQVLMSKIRKYLNEDGG